MRVIPSLSKLTRFIAPMVVIVGGLMPWVAAGCSGSYGSSICAASCECTGCSTVAHDSCVKDIDDSVKVSGDVGCGEEVDAYLSCVSGRGQCIGTKYETGGCDIEVSRAGNCLGTAKCILIGLQIHCIL